MDSPLSCCAITPIKLCIFGGNHFTAALIHPLSLWMCCTVYVKWVSVNPIMRQEASHIRPPTHLVCFSESECEQMDSGSAACLRACRRKSSFFYRCDIVFVCVGVTFTNGVMNTWRLKDSTLEWAQGEEGTAVFINACTLGGGAVTIQCLRTFVGGNHIQDVFIEARSSVGKKTH